jgi:ribosomal protein S18 acetylase RimI-like enzyme
MQLIETRDKDLLRDVFHRDPLGSMYMRGDLRSPFFEQCRWFAAVSGGSAVAVIMIYTGLSVPAVLACGDPATIGQLITAFLPELPTRFYTKLEAAQSSYFGQVFRLSDEQQLLVMGLATLHAVPPTEGVAIRILSPDEPVDPLLGVYRDYPGNFFEPACLTAGVYAGAYVGGDLAAVAGTHAFAPEERVAVIGNVVTAARFRGRRLCQAVVSFLIKKLQEDGCKVIGLHVATDNLSAIRCYQRIGFQKSTGISQFFAERL